MSSNNSDSGASEPRTPWSRPGFLFAGAFVVLIVILLVLVLVLTNSGRGGGSTSGQANPAPGVGRETTTTAPPTSVPASVPVDAGPTTVPDAPPDDVTWQLYNGVALPYSAQAGPRQITDSTAAGYSHTPTGALMAAAQIPIRKLIAPNWQAVVDQQIVPGPGRDAFLTERGQVTDTGGSNDDYGQFAGFEFVNYTAAEATVQLVARFVSGSLQMTTITVEWLGGDWKEVLQPNGSDSPSAQKIPNLIGYVQWGGVQ